MLYVKADSPFTNLSDVIADAKAESGTQKWAAGSPTSLSRISLEAMKKSTGVDVTVVPHDSGSDTLLNVLNGTLEVGIGEAGETASTSPPAICGYRGLARGADGSLAGS